MAGYPLNFLQVPIKLSLLKIAPLNANYTRICLVNYQFSLADIAAIVGVVKYQSGEH